MKLVPTASVLQPAVVRIAGIHFGDAVVERYEHGDGEEDRYRKDDCGQENEQTGGSCHRAMLEGHAEYEGECKSVPERHHFAEHAGQLFERERCCQASGFADG